MKSCRTCKIFEICVFNDRIREAMEADEDRYLDNNDQATLEVEQVLAAHCQYYTEPDL